MFSGIVQELGEVCFLEPQGKGLALGVKSTSVFSSVLLPGCSIAVDGVCLTLKFQNKKGLFFDVIPETLACTTLGERQCGDLVNLESALKMGESVGGHLLSGHVLETAEISDIKENRYYFLTPKELAPYLFDKGFIAVDGVSLTIVSVDFTTFSVGLIPETLQRTTLGKKGVGERVNIEIDMSTKVQVDTMKRILAQA
ncbi:Riboflavin synthase alpha chain,riboflavin synthase subunit alpha,riboflavin synthase, alpha subunit,Lumazine binding domain [Chlamydia serpentis]|uniref:Riboflavin synthase n=1 Tax=Chlamydia serpentis TaxID=1967782 RepID=A0A2R8FBC8_9CHLA|nr:riboflavin synthase subunit alpha [Chlamydia serpentis]SPN73651.1 Riboflavin synthase alpha chain,riboflavin synthase subunit alpha,riboflavin synthase, alpha subunit,Lumazine binding domain [Chlamydia serpentis]